MAENRLPRALPKLIAHARHQARACAKWQDTLGLTHVRARHLGRAAATARAAEKELRAAHAHWSATRAERRRLDLESWDFIAHARAYLIPALGRKWNLDWQLAGFTRHRLRVPERFADREQLLEALADALADTPAWERPECGFTAAAVAAQHAALTAADTGHTSSRVRLRRARLARNSAVAGLNRTLRALKKELRLVLDPADPRWLEFRLNPPVRPRAAKAKDCASAAPAPSFGVPASAGAASDNTTAPANHHATEAEAGACETTPRSANAHSENLLGVPPSGGPRASEPSEGGTPNRAPHARPATTLPGDEDELMVTASPIPAGSRRSFWNLLRAGARKITWNLF